MLLAALITSQVLIGLDYQATSLDSIPSGRTVVLNTRHDTVSNCDEKDPFTVRRYEVSKTLVGWQDRMVGRYKIGKDPIEEMVFQRFLGDRVFLTASLAGGDVFQAWCLPSAEIEGMYVQFEEPDRVKIAQDRPMRSTAGDKAAYSAVAIAGGTVLGLLGGALYGALDGTTTQDAGEYGYLMAGAGVGLAAGLFVTFQICFSGL